MNIMPVNTPHNDSCKYSAMYVEKFRNGSNGVQNMNGSCLKKYGTIALDDDGTKENTPNALMTRIDLEADLTHLTIWMGLK